MKNNILTIAVGAVLLGLSSSSCSSIEVDPRENLYQETFINGYLVPDRIEIGQNDDDPSDTQTLVVFNGDSLITHGARFEALTKLNNDYYKRTGVPEMRIVFADGLKYVKVLTKSDFDGSHPAGSDVSDLVECNYETYYNYIHSGFTAPETTSEITSRGRDINADNTKLMLPRLHFSFGQKPTASGTYGFDLIFHFANTDIKGEVSYEFK